MTRMRSWVDAALGLSVIAFGLLEAQMHGDYAAGSSVPLFVIAVAMGVAVGVHRGEPGLALMLVWIACGLQVLSGLDIMFAQLGVVVVAYGAARFGSTSIVWASGLSIPLAYVIGATYLLGHGSGIASTLGVDSLTFQSLPPVAVLAASASVPLALPWLIGMALRMSDRARTNREERIRAEENRTIAEAGRAQAEEIARVREEQARLARDVHDVVGHSLAVILAQAESAQYLPSEEPTRLQDTMANIATSARQSLGDVRRVLSATHGEPVAPPPGGLDSLIDGVRASGATLNSTVIGTPITLPPELAIVAYRVLQEMLTNALKHGVPTQEVTVTRTWHDGLLLEVINKVGTSPAGLGLGVDGMHRRLAVVGGTLTLEQDDDTHVARAWLPTGDSDTKPAWTQSMEGE